MHESILRIFIELKKSGLTKAELSKRLGRAPEQITRWLAAPGNLRLDTVSDLLLAMNHELVFSVRPIETAVRRNHFHELASLQPSIAVSSKNTSFKIRSSSIEEVKIVEEL
jgi:hypothetical protein